MLCCHDNFQKKHFNDISTESYNESLKKHFNWFSSVKKKTFVLFNAIDNKPQHVFERLFYEISKIKLY